MVNGGGTGFKGAEGAGGAALVEARDLIVIGGTGVDAGTAGEQGVRECGAAVVLQRVQERVHAVAVGGKVAEQEGAKGW